MSATLYELFIAPWTWGEWMWRALLGGALTSTLCAALGVFLYLRRMSMISDALAHVALPGIVATFALTGHLSPLPTLIGAALMGVIATALIQGLESRRGVASDAAIGIVFTTLFSLGVIGLSVVGRQAHIDADCIIYGNLLAISNDALWTLAGAAVVVITLLAVAGRWLFLVAFDARHAALAGVPVLLLHYGLMGAVALVSVASFNAVGSILVIALFTLPAASAHALARTPWQMVLLSVLFANVSTLLGTYVGVWTDITPAASVVLVAALIYVLCRSHLWWQDRISPSAPPLETNSHA